MLVSGTKIAVVEYYANTGKLPDNASQLGRKIGEPITGQVVADISINPGGIIAIRYSKLLFKAQRAAFSG